MRKLFSNIQAAKYVSIGAAGEFSHYGLSFPVYTHFTSPIRRYADLLVHRLVTISLEHKEKTPEVIESMDYQTLAELCSEKSLSAKRAS